MYSVIDDQFVYTNRSNLAVPGAVLFFMSLVCLWPIYSSNYNPETYCLLWLAIPLAIVGCVLVGMQRRVIVDKKAMRFGTAYKSWSKTVYTTEAVLYPCPSPSVEVQDWTWKFSRFYSVFVRFGEWEDRLLLEGGFDTEAEARACADALVAYWEDENSGERRVC